MSQPPPPPPPAASGKHLDPTAAPYQARSAKPVEEKQPKKEESKPESPAGGQNVNAKAEVRGPRRETKDGRGNQNEAKEGRGSRRDTKDTRGGQSTPQEGRRGQEPKEGGGRREGGRREGGRGTRDNNDRRGERQEKKGDGEGGDGEQPSKKSNDSRRREGGRGDRGGDRAERGENKLSGDRIREDITLQMEGHSALAKTIAHQLACGQYECMICTDRIRHATATWSCETCFRIFHLSCAKKWADSDGSGSGTQFRCPGCQHQYPTRPKRYQCFCAKTTDPHNDGYSVPHSCGDHCGRKRKNGCPHPCMEKCHPGPCSDCTIRVKPRNCPCGRTSYDFLCGKDDPKTTCKSICGKALLCGEHHCEELCHQGPCAPCKVESTMPCLCGKNTKTSICGSPNWNCDQPCGEMQRCGNHTCNVVCHKGACPPCDADVDLITHCPCGQKAIPKGIRPTCKAPVPTCGSICGKVLLCGNHYCEQECHTGPCPECSSKITIKCPCNSNTKKVLCMEADLFRCSQKCKTKLTCGRHECENLCCLDKGKPTAHEHQCRKTCKKQLVCGHPCDESCHRGACPPCHRIVTTELVCNCGQEILYPPAPCGTEPPICFRPCTVPSPCGHQSVPHNCHFGPCPPCMKTVTRPCMGGHTDVANVVCSMTSVSCGNPCGKVLPCKHFCLKKCHSGACLPEPKNAQDAKKNQCTQNCGAVLACGHTCPTKCHVGKECNKCSTKVEIVCECGATTRNVPCAEYQVKLAAVKLRSSPNAEEEEGGSSLNASEQVEMHAKVTFPCTDDCSYQRRLNALASLGGAGVADSGDRWGKVGTGMAGNSGRRTFYSIEAWSAARADVDGILSVEKLIASFLASGAPDIMLPVMTKERRVLVHELCWYYHIACEAYDREPQRSCFLTRTPNTAIPSPMLSVAVYDDYENPNDIARKIMTNGSEATKKTIVMEGDGLHRVAVHGLMKQFAGQMIIVPHEAKEAAFFLVFPWGGDMGTAYSYLRRQSLPSVRFYRYGDDPRGSGSGGGGASQSYSPLAATAGGGGTATKKAKGPMKSWASLARDPVRKDAKEPVDTRNAFGALRK